MNSEYQMFDKINEIIMILRSQISQSGNIINISDNAVKPSLTISVFNIEHSSEIFIIASPTQNSDRKELIKSEHWPGVSDLQTVFVREFYLEMKKFKIINSRVLEAVCY